MIEKKRNGKNENIKVRKLTDESWVTKRQCESTYTLGSVSTLVD